MNAYTQWLLQFDRNNKGGIFDDTGIYANETQPVFFLVSGGNISQPISVVNQSITVKRGTMILHTGFTYFNWIEANSSDTDPTDKANLSKTLLYIKLLETIGVKLLKTASLAEQSSIFVEAYVKQLNIKIASQVDGCTIDMFSQGLIYTKPEHVFPVPVNDFVGSTVNSFDGATSGYAVILRPLKPGKHTITVTRSARPNNNTKFWSIAPPLVGANFTRTVNYDIMVV